jgi:hypothetical protein
MSEYSQRLKGFRNHLKIDGNNLGEECLGQATLYDNIGNLVSEIKRDARTAKDTMEFVAARLKKDARQNPGKFGIAKITEASLDEAVKTHDDFRAEQQKYTEAQYLADCAAVLLTAAEQRKSMIKDSVSMAIHQLYSSHHDLSKDQHALTRAEGEVNEQDINDLRRSNASAREQENNQESTDVQS